MNILGLNDKSANNYVNSFYVNGYFLSTNLHALSGRKKKKVLWKNLEYDFEMNMFC